MSGEQKILDDETLKRLASDLQKAREALADADVGTLHRVDAHRRLREILDEIDSYFG